MELKCNICKHFQNTSFCSYLKEYLPNGYAKLYFGGAIGEYYGKTKYPGRCGTGYEPKEQAELETAININIEPSPVIITYRKKKQT